MASLADHLTAFARDQLTVLKGWQGQHYVQRCLTLWEQEYGRSVSAAVRANLGDALTPAGPPTNSRGGGG